MVSYLKITKGFYLRIISREEDPFPIRFSRFHLSLFCITHLFANFQKSIHKPHECFFLLICKRDRSRKVAAIPMLLGQNSFNCPKTWQLLSKWPNYQLFATNNQPKLYLHFYTELFVSLLSPGIIYPGSLERDKC